MWLVLLVTLAAAHFAVHTLVRRRGGSWRGLETSGPLILWKTRRGHRLMERIGRPTRSWSATGDAAIILTVATGLGVLLLLAARAVTATRGGTFLPPTPGGLRSMLGLPGVNPLIPIGYGLAALLVAVVVHEGAHAVMAYANRMRLKSSGVVLLGLPIGAFVEPDPAALHAATTRARNHVIAAGPAANLALALVSMLLLSVLLSNIHVANDGTGLGVTRVVPDSPADRADIASGAVLLSADGTPLLTNRDLQEVLATKLPGDAVGLVWLDHGERRAAEVELAPHPDKPDDGMLGLGTLDLAYVEGLRAILARPLRDGADSFDAGTMMDPPGSFFLYLAYPTLTFGSGVDPLAHPTSAFLEPQERLAEIPHAVLAGVASLLYWLFWTNLMLATFNALPFPLLDGGQLLRNTLRGRLLRSQQLPAGATRPPQTLAEDDLTASAPTYAPQLDQMRRRLGLLTRAAMIGTLLLLLAPPLLIRAAALV